MGDPCKRRPLASLVALDSEVGQSPESSAGGLINRVDDLGMEVRGANEGFSHWLAG